MFTEGWVDYLTGPFGIFFAIAAGVISFLSPCVLPLVPAYLAHLTGVASDPDAEATRRETMTHALAFVSGFGIVFTAIGASVGLAGGLVRDELPTLEKVAGVFLIILGLNLMGVLKIPWLYRSYQVGGDGVPSSGGMTLATAGAGAGSSTSVIVSTRSTALSYGRSLGMGASFAIAWTPCIGPVMGAIFALAAKSSTVATGAYLLLAYSVGLAVPFLITGFAIGSVTRFLKRFNRFLPALELGTGALVVVVGILIFLNELTSLNQYFQFIDELNAV